MRTRKKSRFIRASLKFISGMNKGFDPRITVRTMAQLVELVKENNIKTTTEYKKFTENNRHTPKNPLTQVKGVNSWKDVWQLAWGIVPREPRKRKERNRR